MLGHRTGETSRVSKPRPAGQAVGQLSNRLHRMTAALGLILLTAGILSCSADVLLNHSNAEYIAWTWRYDSGLVVSGVPDVAAALALTANQQTSIGFSCDGVFATPSNPITTCNGIGKSALINLPQSGEGNDDHNPARVKPRNVFNLAIGTDNLLHSDGHKRITASVEFVNLTDKVALYNFLSTFSGTHFLGPRTIAARLGLSF